MNRWFGEERLNKYEALLIFLPSMKDEELERALDGVRKEIGRLGGEAGGAELLGKRMFARPMKKQNEGRYFRLKFKLEPSQVDSLKARLKLNADVFRVQFSRAVEKKAVENAPAAAGGSATRRG